MPDLQMARIGDYCNVAKGKIGIKKAVAGEYPLVTTAAERLSHNECHFDKPSVIIPVVSSTGHGHASLKRIHYQEGKFAVGSILCAVTPKDENVLNANFLYHYLNVYKEKLLVSRMRGMANVTLPVSEIEDVEFPLLSTGKQEEWVSLFENTASYTGGLASEINHQQTLIKKLRQSILQDAISGRLTKKWREENHNIEPASVLLASIKAEKERLVIEKKIKKQKPLPPISDDEIPFDLPEGWGWCRLGEIACFITSGSRDWAKYYSSSGAIFVRMGNLSRDSFNLRMNKLQYVNPPDSGEGKRTKLLENDILISITGDVGLLGLIPSDFGEAYINQHTGMVRLHHATYPRYFAYIFLTNFLKTQFDAPQRGMKNSFRLTDIQDLIVPIAPTDESFAVVSQIEKLFTYCAELEQHIGKSQRDSKLLMQAVLKEAFER